MQTFSTIAKLWSSLNLRTRNNIDKKILTSVISAFFYYIKQFPIKSRSNECHKLLESSEKSELKNLGIQKQNSLQYDDFNKRWYDLIIDILFPKIHKKQKHSKTKAAIPLFFDETGLEFIILISILHENQKRNSLPDPLKDDEVLSTVYCLANTIQNKFFNHKETVNIISVTNTLTYGADIMSAAAKNQIL